MPKDLYERFPYIAADNIIIRKLSEADTEALFEIFSNDNMFQYIPDFLHTKDKEVLRNAIRRIGEQDFYEERWIMAGVYLTENPGRVIGTAEIFDYNREVNAVEIGYRVNEKFWGRGIAGEIVQALTDYLFREIGLNRIQATVLPENIQSKRVLLKNGFTKEGLLRQVSCWKGRGVVDLEMYSLLKSDVINGLRQHSFRVIIDRGEKKA